MFKEYQKEGRLVSILSALLLILPAVSAQPYFRYGGFYGGALTSIISFISIANFYNTNWAFVNFILYLILFIGLIQKTLGEREYPKSVTNIFGLMLALSLSLTEYYTQFNIITGFGPAVFLLLIAWIFYAFMGILEGFGLAKPAAFAVAFTLLGYYILFSATKPLELFLPTEIIGLLQLVWFASAFITAWALSSFIFGSVRGTAPFGGFLWDWISKAGRGIKAGGGIAGRGIAGAAGGVSRAAKWVGNKYDWEKEKREAKGIADFLSDIYNKTKSWVNKKEFNSAMDRLLEFNKEHLAYSSIILDRTRKLLSKTMDDPTRKEDENEIVRNIGYLVKNQKSIEEYLTSIAGDLEAIESETPKLAKYILAWEHRLLYKNYSPDTKEKINELVKATEDKTKAILAVIADLKDWLVATRKGFDSVKSITATLTSKVTKNDFAILDVMESLIAATNGLNDATGTLKNKYNNQFIAAFEAYRENINVVTTLIKQIISEIEKEEANIPETITAEVVG